MDRITSEIKSYNICWNYKWIDSGWEIFHFNLLLVANHSNQFGLLTLIINLFKYNDVKNNYKIIPVAQFGKLFWIPYLSEHYLSKYTLNILSDNINPYKEH